MKNTVNTEIKYALGFYQDYITIFKGNTYYLKNWFSVHEAKYNTIWGWYFPSDRKLPDKFPAGISPIKLFWEDICDETKEHLSSLSKINTVIDELKNPSSSCFVGEIGNRYNFYVKVYKKYRINSDYGLINFYILRDKYDNIYTWSSKKHLSSNKEYCLRGTVKEHNIYNGQKQTVLTRCSIMEEY